MKKAAALCCGLLWLGCASPEARRPLNTPKDTFLKNSANHNKMRFAQEQKQFKIVANNTPELEFTVSEKGFWYALLEEKATATSSPKVGDQVTVNYQIESLNGSLIYDEATLGEVEFLVDKEDVIPALREGVKVLKPGQKGLFLFPSFMCFGVQGDFEKIGSRQSLRFIITLVAIKSEK